MTQTQPMGHKVQHRSYQDEAPGTQLAGMITAYYYRICWSQLLGSSQPCLFLMYAIQGRSSSALEGRVTSQAPNPPGCPCSGPPALWVKAPLQHAPPSLFHSRPLTNPLHTPKIAPEHLHTLTNLTWAPKQSSTPYKLY